MTESALLRELTRWWADLNDTHFEGAVRPPLLCLDDSTRQLGSWTFQGRTLRLSRTLVNDHPWGAVLEVLRHEMAHQYVHEVLGILDETAHGPAFRQVCQERSIDARARGNPSDHREMGVLRKVHGLLALADSENEHEARAAMNAAHRLMRRHNVDAVAAGPVEYEFTQVGRTSRRFSTHERVLAGILGAHFFVQPIWVFATDRDRGGRGRVLELCGRPENLEIATHVHAFVLESAERLWRSHKKEHGITSNKDRRRFLAGVVTGFDEKLDGEAAACEETGLVWVGDADLTHWVAGRHPHMRAGRRARIRTDSAWHAGRAAGQRVIWRRPIKSKPKSIIAGLLQG